MKIVITGSRGFIGSHLKNHYKDKHDIVEWDRSIDKHIEDFTLPSGVGAVVHLAALADVRRSIAEPDLYWQNNVINTKRIQDMCAEHNVKLLYASSSCIHKWSLSPYGTTKKVNEETAHAGQIGLRFTTVYGDGARDTMFMGRLLSGDLQYSTNHVRDFIHVSDVVSAIDTIIFSEHVPQHRAYDVGTGIGNTVSSLADLAGYNIPVKDGDPCEAQDNTADITPMQEEFGWEPTVDVKRYIMNHQYEGTPI